MASKQNQTNGNVGFDRVRENTAEYVNEDLDERAEDRVRGFAAQQRRGNDGANQGTRKRMEHRAPD